MSAAEVRKLEPKRSLKPLYVKTAIAVVCGPKQFNPNSRAHINEGWQLEEKEHGVLIGYTCMSPGAVKQTHWAFVPWDSVQFVEYEPVEEI